MKKIIWILFCSVNALASIPPMGAKKLNPKAIVFNSNYSMEARWDAYHQIVTREKNESLKIANKALKSPDWFLREAGLKTLVALKPEYSKQIARELLKNDPSMLVRAQALSAIKILKDKKSEKLLWDSLEDSKNFRGDQSLWIRPKIVATLMEFKLGQKAQFKKLLEDRDPQVQRLAATALKNLN